MDAEKNANVKSVDSSPSGRGGLAEFGDSKPHKQGFAKNFIDSFKRDPNAHATPKGAVGANGKVSPCARSSYGSACLTVYPGL